MPSYFDLLDEYLQTKIYQMVHYLKFVDVMDELSNIKHNIAMKMYKKAIRRFEKRKYITVFAGAKRAFRPMDETEPDIHDYLPTGSETIYEWKVKNGLIEPVYMWYYNHAHDNAKMRKVFYDLQRRDTIIKFKIRNSLHSTNYEPDWEQLASFNNWSYY